MASLAESGSVCRHDKESTDRDFPVGFNLQCNTVANVNVM